MTQTTANVDSSTATFQNWLTKTNDLAFALQTVTVTANTTLGNTSGNCHVKGFFAANTLVAVANIAGGTIAANGSGLPEITFANLNFITNSVHTANVYFNTGITFVDGSVATHSNTHVFNSNVTANGAMLIIGTATGLRANGGVGTAAQVLSSNGTTAYWRTISEMSLADSVVSTSITVAATANAVKTAYDAATVAVYTFGTKTFNANLIANGSMFILNTATGFRANGTVGTAGQVLTSNGTTAYWSTIVQGGGQATNIVDSISNTSIVDAAAANSVKRAYDAATIGVYTFGARTYNANLTANGSQFIINTATGLSANASVGTAGQILTSNGTTVYWQTKTLNSFTNDSGYITSSSLTWTNITGRPTALSQFTNDSAFITTAGRAFPRRSDGTSIDIIYSAQGGQPTYVTGTTDGLSYYVYNPSNFAVASATSASAVPWTGVTGRPTALSSFTNDSGYITTTGRAFTKRSDGTSIDFDYSAIGGTPTKVWGTTDGLTFKAYDPANFAVASAAAVPFSGVTSANAVLRHITSGYTTSGRVSVSATEPSSPLQGDIWLQI
jgi:hypothetical protein